MLKVYKAELSGNDGLVKCRENLYFHFARYQWDLKDPTSNPDEGEHKRRVIRRINEKGIDFTNKESLKGEFVLAHSPFISSYYHLMTDLVPFLLKEFYQLKNKKLLISSLLPNSYKEYFIHLGFDLREIRENKNYIVDSLVIPDITNEGKLEWTQDKLAIIRDHYSIPNFIDIKNNQKIYVSRRNVKKRHLVNEDKYFGILRDKGYRVLYLERMSIIDQIRVFSQCSHLIAAHGAGLVNVIFMPYDAQIFEIRPALNSGQFCFENLCSLKWKNYKYYVPSPKAHFELSNYEFHKVFSQINDE